MYSRLSQLSDGINALNVRITPLAWIMRTRGEPYAVRSVVQESLRVASGGLPVARIRSMEEIVVRSTARSDFNMLLLTVFGGVALLLAAIWIYGLIAYSVEQRPKHQPRRPRRMLSHEGHEDHEASLGFPLRDLRGKYFVALVAGNGRLVARFPRPRYAERMAWTAIGRNLRDILYVAAYGRYQH